MAKLKVEYDIMLEKMALQRKRELEARKLANEKYGIPENEDLT